MKLKSGQWRSILLALVIFVGLPVAGLMLLWKDRCQKSVLQTILSPDRAYQVEQVVTDCGASMHPATEIVIRRSDQLPRDNKQVLLLPNAQKLTITWETNQTLGVWVPPQAQIVNHVNLWDGIAIEIRGGPVAPPRFSAQAPDLVPKAK